MKKTALPGQKSSKTLRSLLTLRLCEKFFSRKDAKTAKSVLLFLSAVVFFSCGCGEKKSKPVQQQPQVQLPSLPEFNADSAYAFVKAQVDFGPRVPNSKAHVACGDYLISKMKSWCDTVIVQPGVVTTYDGVKINFRNIISSFNVESKNRILLFAHWDTRPWADQDTKDTDKPALGADDGGSGVGVLMEIARQLQKNKPGMGIDLAFFDAEDWGKEGGGGDAEDSWALGTQYWAKNPHVPGYTASYGILLDMTGGKGTRFRKEGFSKDNAGFVVEKVWQIANQLGYSGYFLYEEGGYVTDDHVYVNKANIPAIDIIGTVPGTQSGFPPHHHTHDDNMDIIDVNTLRAVGQTLMGVIFWPEAI